MEESGIPFELAPSKPFLRSIYLAISDLIKDEDTCIDSIRHSNYHEHYCFSKQGEKATFRIYYNDKDKITQIEKPSVSSQWAGEVFLLLSKLENKSIILASEKEDAKILDVEFEFDRPLLKEFYESIREKTARLNIRISQIQHKDYHEIYEFQRSGFVATYKFHYNSQGRFGKVELVNSRTTGLVEEINGILGN